MEVVNGLASNQGSDAALGETELTSRLILALALAVLGAGARPAAAEDVLRFRVTSLGGRMYDYFRVSNVWRLLRAGDTIEYDVYAHSNRPGVGGFDVGARDGVYLRDVPGWVDQNGISGHPAADISAQAFGRWHHRKLAVPAERIGTIANTWDVAVDGDGFVPHEVYAAMYDNIRVTNAGKVVQWIYRSGPPVAGALDFRTPTVESEDLIVTAPRRAGVQTCAHFFYWYDAPANNADPEQMVFDPHGLANTGAWKGYGRGAAPGGFYSSMNTAWWEAAFADCKRAGVDAVDLICWGNHPYSWFQIDVLKKYMVPALKRSGNDLKIALFDDTTSECAEWNVDQGRGYSVEVPMPLSDPNNWTYFYDRKIKPFYQAIPKKYWATHNGLGVEAGGRPLIITYTSAWFSDVGSHGAAMWEAIRAAFARDFKTAAGEGILPFFVHEASWVANGAGASADSSYSWGAALFGPSVGGAGGWLTGSVGPGYDDRLIRSPGNFRDREAGGFLTSTYNGTYDGKRLWDCNLVLMETWNELWEGTAIERCVDYSGPDGPLPEAFYMDRFGRDCVTTTIGRRDLDATFLRTWTLPARLRRGEQVTLHVRNDGLQPWDPSGSRTVRLGVYLDDVPGSLVRVPLTSSALSGQEASITFTVPRRWPKGSHVLRLDMVAGSKTWFRDQGDSAARVPVRVR
jgi:hypothetical protein